LIRIPIPWRERPISRLAPIRRPGLEQEIS
jgi:hypothetical protein